jgi:putative ABC transport system substrate-binding protein
MNLLVHGCGTDQTIGRRSFVRRLAGLGASAAGLAVFGCDILTTAPATRVKVRRIGFLSSSSREATVPILDLFLDGLRQLGWVEGDNLMIEWRFADGRLDLLPGMAAELVRTPIDLIVTVTTPPALAAQQQTSTIPIVAVNMANPVENGLVASLARPGGNTTGTAALLAETFTKMVELLKEIVPGLSRLAFMLDTSQPTLAPARTAVREIAQTLALQLLELNVRSAADVQGAFASATDWGANGHLFLNPALTPAIKQIAELATMSRLPGASNNQDYCRVGGLLSYVQNGAALWRHAATYVDRILKGAQPADLPIDQPNVYDVMVNVKTAQALGLMVPPDVAAQVTEWVQ